MDEYRTKGEKRESKRRKRRKMGVSGRGVRVIQDIIRRRAEKIREEEAKDSEKSNK